MGLRSALAIRRGLPRPDAVCSAVQMQEMAKCGAVVSACMLPCWFRWERICGVASLVGWLVVMRPQEVAECGAVVSAGGCLALIAVWGGVGSCLLVGVWVGGLLVSGRVGGRVGVVAIAGGG